MTTFKNCILILFIATGISCATTQKTAHNNSAGNLVVDGKLWSSLFQQKAAEYNALCYQAYNIAKSKVDEALKKNHSKPLAVITDIDETMLDNSPYAVHRALANQDYSSESWREWTAQANAQPLRGSVDFFNYAASKGVTVFYITNRNEIERNGTLSNIKKFKYPFADNDHLILKQGKNNSKESRRQDVAKNYEIILFLGDNLSDFSMLWDEKSQHERNKNVDDNAAFFGNKFIVFPNTNYGGWEDAIYGNQYNLTPAQKDSAIKANLKGY
jgi:5'-nucleotidase (lipoprotein e(P4) family)